MVRLGLLFSLIIFTIKFADVKYLHQNRICRNSNNSNLYQSDSLLSDFSIFWEKFKRNLSKKNTVELSKQIEFPINIECLIGFNYFISCDSIYKKTDSQVTDSSDFSDRYNYIFMDNVINLLEKCSYQKITTYYTLNPWYNEHMQIAVMIEFENKIVCDEQLDLSKTLFLQFKYYPKNRYFKLINFDCTN